MWEEKDIITYNEVVKIGDLYLLPQISGLYGLEGYEIKHIERNYIARNVVYNCEKEGFVTKILRISFLGDRSREDFLAEVEYIRYLHEHGGNVADVITSCNGNLMEEIDYGNHTFYICLFEKARGKMLVENNYKYREGVPLSEYFYNCGKVLGKIHQLSKEYAPVHSRYSFFDKFNFGCVDDLIPDSLPLLKEKMYQTLKSLQELGTNNDFYGMIHFDFNDGNYSIDFDTGKITAYDFDNSLFGWYMYDLADFWGSQVGWAQFEQDVSKREKFMDDFFKTVLNGYKSETEIEDSMLDKLQLFISASCMENILCRFKDMLDHGENFECDEGLCYLIKCMEDDIPYRGFFNEIYMCDTPFECETRIV